MIDKQTQTLLEPVAALSPLAQCRRNCAERPCVKPWSLPSYRASLFALVESDKKELTTALRFFFSFMARFQ